jgi:hypothetical protein
MKDFVLAIVGTVGIAALAMSMTNENKPIREDFNSGFAFRNSKLDKVVKNDAKGNVTSLAVDQMPNVTCASTPARPKTVENYSSRNNRVVGSGLGANEMTNLPYVTPTRHLNQTVNKPSPSMNLPAVIRYNPPSLSNMGVTEDYQCNKSGPIRENYTPPQTCMKAATPYMSPVAEYPGSAYTASPLPAAVMSKDFVHPEDNLAKSGDLMDPFDGKEVMVFDRPMTTTLKVGRFAGRGTRDLIRGDLPCAPNTHQGWFSTPADPSALSKGALQVMGGDSESTTTMNKFMEIYGDASGIGSGVNLADKPDYQYTAYEMTHKKQGVCNNTVSVSSF